MTNAQLQENNLVAALKVGIIDFPKFLELYKQIEFEHEIKLRPATELIKEALSPINEKAS